MSKTKEEVRVRKKSKISEARRTNARIYPIYKMFSWDLLFFYSIEFLFYTITKGITASQILIINGFYLAFKVICQLPSVMIADFIGKRKTIIIGNIFLMMSMLILIFLPGAFSVVLAFFFYAFGYSLKLNSESNLLYDSVSTRGGDGIYTKLDGRGASLHNILEGMASFVAGFLFVMNNYIPLIICLIFIFISTVLSFKFRDIYEVKKRDRKPIKDTIREYGGELKQSFSFILRSERMKAFVLFQVVFYGFIRIMATYQSDLLVTIGIPEEEFSMVYAVLTVIGGLSMNLTRSVEKRYKNKTLTVLSMTHIMACVVIGVISSCFIGKGLIPIILILLAIQKITNSIWDILEYKYLKNFTTENSRVKISFAYEMVGSLGASICSFMGGLLLDFVTIQNAYLLIGLAFIIFMTLTLDYMRKRFGLRPKDYRKEDIVF